MDTNALVAVGLNHMQAKTYALLMEHGELTPPQAAKSLKTTRTNAYKLLDKLVEIKLARREEKNKKLTYYAANPIALTSLTAQYRAEAAAREEAVSGIMQELLTRYHKHSDQPDVGVYTGRKDVAAAYRKQIALHEDVYFIHTAADVPMMGFDTMHEIRIAPGRFGNQRRAIMSAPEKGPINYKAHERSNLNITWAAKEQYNAPVEWSVTDSSLLIVLYATEPHAILITDPVVASAFMQLWHMLSSLLQSQELHKKTDAKR